MQVKLDKAQCLIDAAAEFNLQTLLKGLPTLHAMASGNYTGPDNVFMSSSLCTTVVCCETIPEE